MTSDQSSQHTSVHVLAYLLKEALESGYRANAGIISFDPDRTVRRKLNQIQETIQHPPTSRNIKVYGLESIELLQRTPF